MKLIKNYNFILVQGVAKKSGATIADTIVLAGVVGLEQAIKKGGSKVKVPFVAGRGDASQDQTDIERIQINTASECTS